MVSIKDGGTLMEVRSATVPRPVLGACEALRARRDRTTGTRPWTAQLLASELPLLGILTPWVGIAGGCPASPLICSKRSRIDTGREEATDIADFPALSRFINDATRKLCCFRFWSALDAMDNARTDLAWRTRRSKQQTVQPPSLSCLTKAHHDSRASGAGGGWNGCWRDVADLVSGDGTRDPPGEDVTGLPANAGADLDVRSGASVMRGAVERGARCGYRNLSAAIGLVCQGSGVPTEAPKAWGLGRAPHAQLSDHSGSQA